MLVLEQCTWQDVTIYKPGQFSTCPVSCRGVKLKEKTWLNCSEKFSLTMHHEFSSSCSRIKILLQKIFASSRHRWAGMTEDWKRERIFIYWKCAQDQTYLIPQIFFEHPKKAWLYGIPARVPCKAQPSASIQWQSSLGLACRDNTVPGK